MLTGQYKATKKILWKYLAISGKATMPRMIGGEGVQSADSPSWLFFRINEFIDLLQKQRKLKTYITSKEMNFVQQKLQETLDDLWKTRFNDLITNNQGETWMDTVYGEDKRDGARIEIQAGTLAMLNFLSSLTGKKDPRETALKKSVKSSFWKTNMLKDGKEDPILRPNLFLAALFYPKLLTKKEWTACFDKALKSLWLDWGGLSSIDKKHPLFTAKSTGENPKSYHRGDSWFWINNLAALAMYRTDKKKFGKYIRKIKEASLKEQQMGIIGHSAEISSAEKLKSEGCLSQLWSNATLVELQEEV